jgi:hypothetical protein
MMFKEWIKLNESSSQDLYDSAVEAFPNTTKRQHATQPIKISTIKWTPYLGMNTLFVKALAQNEGREYNPIILFKGVKYLDEGGISVMGDMGRVFLEKLSLNDNHVALRCNCPDFSWRFNYFNHVDKSLYGRKRKKYEALYNPGSANPMEMPGMCKHLMKLSHVLNQSGIVD